MKNLFLKMVIAAVAFAGVASAANAYLITPVCQNVWIQTGPFFGQGYYTTVCD